MTAPPKVEPHAGIYIRVLNGTIGRDLRFDEALFLADRVHLFDYTIIAPSLCTLDKADAEQVALTGETRKLTFYNTRIPRENRGSAVVEPLAFSALGRPTSNGFETIKSVAKYLSAGSDRNKAVILRRLYETISISLFRGNVSLLQAYKEAFRTGHQQAE
jgi:hypothetical protein